MPPEACRWACLGTTLSCPRFFSSGLLSWSQSEELFSEQLLPLKKESEVVYFVSYKKMPVPNVDLEFCFTWMKISGSFFTAHEA